MSSELEVALAQVFNKKGKTELAEKDFVFTASFDLRWFTPKEAQRFLDLSIESELLVLEDGKVKPTFDHKTVKAPSGYKPSPDLLKSPVQPKGIFLKLVDQISAEKDIPRKTVISEVNSIQDRMGVDTEVAVLIVARSHGLNTEQYLDEVEEGVAARYKSKAQKK
jgi:hypothetical protein